MQTTRRRDTRAELQLRRELHRRGRRFRVDVPPLPGLRRRADIVFTRQHVAVYVDGCFWHACPEHGTVPRHNQQWWIGKLEANERRDRDTDRRLREAGWQVVRIWEHVGTLDAADEVERQLATP
jgi:DNA mismatch endonuclease (patch repair protein)